MLRAEDTCHPLTKRVNTRPKMRRMKVLNEKNGCLAPSPSLESCEAIIVGLSSNRYTIVRRGQPSPLLADPICKRIRDLKVGDIVTYGGRVDRVRCLRIYR